MSDLDLARWLDKKLRAIDIKKEHLLEYPRRSVRDLLAREDLDMAKLIKGKFILEKVLPINKNELRRKGNRRIFRSHIYATFVLQPNKCIRTTNR